MEKVTLKVNLEICSCDDCPFLGHSGAFTLGGFKAVCHHHDAVSSIAKYRRKTGTDTTKFVKEPYNWHYRIVDREEEPPMWCPLR